MKEIILTEQHKRTLMLHARDVEPNESCAILFGSISGASITVSEVFLTENMEKSPQNFTISNKQLLAAYSTAEEKKTDVVGIFHSHPDSEAYPSSTDREFMDINPVAWVIYSGRDDRFRAFVSNGKIQEISIGWSNTA